MAAQETALQSGTTRWKRFFRDVRAELKKVTWPDRKELLAYTGVVFVSVFLVAVMIWLLDTGFSAGLKAIIK